MRVYLTKHFPFGKFKAFSFCDTIWLKDKDGSFRKMIYDPNKRHRLFRLIQHERTHWFQQREMLIILFFVWYIIEWFIKLFTEQKAYKALSFEREARANQVDQDFYNVVYHKKSISYKPLNTKGSLCNRKWFNWCKYIFRSEFHYK